MPSPDAATAGVFPDPAQPLRGWVVVLLGAMAGGMGWGIRGQYGHETGAMIAGVLLGLTLVLAVGRTAPSLPAVRAAAWCAVAMGFGGSMTYGQTVGLTHDPELVGHWGALGWGMLGLAIKGGLWIGFAGVFLGMGLGGERYRPRDIALLLAGLLGLCWIGIHAVNRPFDPASRLLPAFYFSADWRWRPDAVLKPRPEVWGGYLFAFAGLLVYVGLVRGDRLARSLGLWGLLGGAVGFPAGQCLQAFHAWNRDLFQTGVLASADRCMNWWNWMETTFGAVMGATLALGLWRHRHQVRLGSDHASSPTMPLPRELALLGAHLVLVSGEEFTDLRVFQRLYDFGMMLGFIPMVAIAGGRLAPWWMLLPGIALPIAGKTVRELVIENRTVPPAFGWLVYAVLPLALTGWLAMHLHRRTERGEWAGRTLPCALLAATLLYWGLNFGFFRFPWPWEPWTMRTPNALVFTVCAIGLVRWARQGSRDVSSRLGGTGEGD